MRTALTRIIAALRSRGSDRRPIRVATVYMKRRFGRFEPSAMDTVRWLRVSEALADLGFRVDMILNTDHRLRPCHPNLRVVPFSRVDWAAYDVIKTLFHLGYETLVEEGVEDHPFIISKLGSVVGATDDTEGVHFFGKDRAALWDIQGRIARQSRYVTVLTEQSKALWQQQHDRAHGLLVVPTGVDREIPARGKNPYAGFPEPIAVYLGNIYGSEQKNINLLWQERLNTLGRALRTRGIRLCFVGTGHTERMDPDAVTRFGAISNRQSWDYQHFADVGIALAQGPVQHNESSKIYYYLRTGLPVVAEEAIPNAHLVLDAGLGYTVGHGDDLTMADMIEAAVNRAWDREQAIRYMLERHTWYERVKVYEPLIRAA